MQKRGVCQGGKGGVLALAPPSAGVLPAGRWTERGRPKAAPWGTIFPDPISFDSAKRNGGKSHPGFSGQGFALRRVSFCAHKKKPKMRRGSGAEELQAPRTRFRSKRLHPRTPILRESRLRTAPHPVRRWGKPILEATIFRCRSPGICGKLPDLRVTPSHSMGQARRCLVV